MSKYNKSVVVFHAHPDDTEAFCAGSLALLKQQGFRITIATMTGGGMGSVTTGEEETITIRKEEARRAAEEIGAEYVCLDGRDGFLFDNMEMRLKAADLVRKQKAGVVMTHLPYDYHVDHRATANIAEAGALVAILPNVPCSEPPLEDTPLLYHTAPLGFSDSLGAPVSPPQFFVDVSSTLEKKRAMLTHHQSQVLLMKEMQGMDDFFGEMVKYNRDLGKLAGCEYAEVFWQHLGAGFPREPLLQENLKEWIKPVPEKLQYIRGE